MNSTIIEAEFIATVMAILGEILEAIANAIITASQNTTQMIALANGIFGN